MCGEVCCTIAGATAKQVLVHWNVQLTGGAGRPFSSKHCTSMVVEGEQGAAAIWAKLPFVPYLKTAVSCPCERT